MIANVLNFLVGLGVAYVAIFGIPASAPVPWILAPVGIAIVVLPLIARHSDFSGWQSATNTVLGIVLLVVTLINSGVPLSPLVTFWIELWVGYGGEPGALGGPLSSEGGRGPIRLMSLKIGWVSPEPRSNICSIGSLRSSA